MNYILYNSKANGANNENQINEFVKKLTGENELINVLGIDEYKTFFEKISASDKVYLLGGDGTLNHFINDTKDLTLPCDVYFSGAGTGNDFLNDTKDLIKNDCVLINDLVKNLPTVTVNGKDYLFINGVGYGIDGYCCEVADKLHAKGKQNVNYAGIAIKGILFHYKRPNATVTVDGVTKKYYRVYLAPTMKGRYYGGGMIVAPNQNRNAKDYKVSTVLLYGKSRLGALMIFPGIFKGEHIKHKDAVEVLTGNEIEVTFDRPTALQIDGETILGVTNYKVRTK